MLNPDGPQRELVEDNASLIIKDMVRNTVAMDEISGRVHALIREPLSGAFFGADVRITRQSTEVFFTDYSLFGRLPNDVSPLVILDDIIEMNSDDPNDLITVICDEAVLKRIQSEDQSITWLSEDRFTLLGRPGGTIDVHLYKRGQSREARDDMGVTFF